jgi:hypothetical protein
VAAVGVNGRVEHYEFCKDVFVPRAGWVAIWLARMIYAVQEELCKRGKARDVKPNL